ncbi:Lrp/AsnC family transcriptional regulator [Ralstonia mannitolilytica]|jgi:Lrp/AsnC family leucine-responsive transcriptional regulator|uniref:HTH-type transcriptional regulator LrpC n=1 Tax=Ralstonia mannitolilytica TaxID=105219 RepID=A0AAD2AMA1_9RALS|nr:Lrp/AsnC family transcriptional regulator [Ralstonia mannitolilytica]ANA35718.1 AsnC family transcriptional regulator [Ralstonia mannitolilytica]MBY4718714.1 Lrp/AsnC family transcriptional regulator [Ralstonia mannitolilytica]CAJ0683205.1 HTH-type transcriptional regulator LrpC [Ralstonia mannitolilytica]CAJ0687288.1 HTH-type transcriptional regulator LrpC [Ralstonia mannitolilytica]CAJ0701215.1 HTH-type transcriptional regulator LrpC [Ralstonia mannitolilytica]
MNAIDDVDQRILDVLLTDSRISLKQLAEQVGLSAPSVSERLRRLEERGVIRQYTVDLDPKALGYPLQAIVRVRPMPGKLHIVQRLIEEIPQISECDKVTGEDCFIARLFVQSIDQLDQILDRVADHAETNTAIVKAQPVRRRAPPVARGV